MYDILYQLTRKLQAFSFFKIYISYHLKISLFLIGFTDKWMSTLFSELLLKGLQEQIPKYQYIWILFLTCVEHNKETEARGERGRWREQTITEKAQTVPAVLSQLGECIVAVHLFVGLGLLQGGIFVTSCKLQFRFKYFYNFAMQWLRVFLIFRTKAVPGENRWNGRPELTIQFYTVIWNIAIPESWQKKEEEFCITANPI